MSKLTIGMANYADPQGAWWTLSSLRLHHVSPSNTDIDLLLIDDMPSKNNDLVSVCNLSNARYIHSPKGKGPAHAKNTVFENATGEYVLLLDSHVLLNPFHVKKIMNLIEEDRIGNDMIVGPLVNEAGNIIATELIPEIRGGMLGIWHRRKEEGESCVVHGHGTAYMLMRREAWPKFSEHFYGFSGEEIYIHEKVRRNGGKVVCYFDLKWCHRFMRFGIPPQYRLTLNDKYRNHLVASYEMNWSVEQMKNYFRKKLPLDQCIAVENDVAEIFPNIWKSDMVNCQEFKIHD